MLTNRVQLISDLKLCYEINNSVDVMPKNKTSLELFIFLVSGENNYSSMSFLNLQDPDHRKKKVFAP
jgi:hypothetical protein